MSTSVFLDSGIFIAFLNRRDRWHVQSRQLFGGPRPRWATSLLVIAETYSWFLHRMGEEPARHFRLLLTSLDGLRILEVTLDHHRAVARMLDHLRGSKLTYVDASSLVFVDHHRFDQVWATDHHLSLTGATVLPRL